MTRARLFACALFLGLWALLQIWPNAAAKVAPLDFSPLPSEKNAGPRPRTEKSAADREEFREFLNSSFLSLGRDAANESATAEEKADFSPELLRSSDTLGELADRLERDPQFWNDALTYYTKCAADEGILLPVRAVCYRHLVEHAVTGESRLDDAGISRDVKELAARLP